MNKNLLTIFILCIIGHSLAQIQANASNSTQTPHLRLQSSKTGRVKIFRDNRGFYVLADFKYDYSDANDTLKNNSYPMMLGLYTHQTFLGGKQCIAFDKYDCDAYNCFIINDSTNFTYPYFSTLGKTIEATIYLDYKNWKLSSNAFWGNLCYTRRSSLWGQNTFGILGMGLSGQARNNLFANQVFSIYIDQNMSSGSLMFKKDTSYANSSTPVASIPTDKNWNFSMNGYIDVGSQYTLFINTSVAFDLSTNGIAIPSKIFWDILDRLGKYGVDCDLSDTQVSCDYKGFIKNLPNITIYDGNHKIPLPPQIYVQDAWNTGYVSSVVLNLKPTGSNYTGEYSVSSAFENTIILGWNFMWYYYTVFDNTKTSQVVTIYVAGDRPIDDGDNKNLGYVIAGVFVFLIISAILKCCMKPKKSSRHQENLIVHNQGTFVPNGARNVQFSQPQAYHNPQNFNNWNS